MVKRGIARIIGKLGVFFGKTPFSTPKFVDKIVEFLLPEGDLWIDFYDCKVLIDPQEYVGKNLYMGRFHEQKLVEVIEKELREGDRVLDLGAHIGLITLVFRKNVGVEGKVVAYEPEPGNYEKLTDSIEQNGFKNIEANEKAVSDSSGVIELSKHPNNSGMSSIRRNTDQTYRKAKISASAVLDDYEIDWIKLDLEGAEYEVLKDIKDRLNQLKGVFLEFHPEVLEKEKCFELFATLQEEGNLYTPKDDEVKDKADFEEKLNNFERDFIWKSN